MRLRQNWIIIFERATACATALYFVCEIVDKINANFGQLPQRVNACETCARTRLLSFGLEFKIISVVLEHFLNLFNYYSVLEYGGEIFLGRMGCLQICRCTDDSELNWSRKNL